jgi:hypothetical protein
MQDLIGDEETTKFKRYPKHIMRQLGILIIDDKNKH